MIRRLISQLRLQFMLLGFAVGAAVLLFAVSALVTGRFHFVKAQQSTVPVISGVAVSKTGTTSTVITWQTDKPTDSAVNFSVDRRYGTARDPASTTSHTVTIDGLDPGTTYFFRIVAEDADGNQNISSDFTFTTGGANNAGLSQVSKDQVPVTAKVLALLDQIKDEKALQLLLQKLQDQADKNVAAPRIIGNPDVKIGDDTVTIDWETDKDANSLVAFAADGEYKAGADNPYVTQQGKPDEYGTQHEVVLQGLKPGTLYHYEIISKTQLGEEADTRDRTFTTKAVIPALSGIRLEKVEEHAATVVWTTNIPSSGLVDYTNMLTRKSASKGDPTLLVTHSVHLDNLDFKTPYSVVITAQNQAGDVTKSQPLTFVTIKDEVPPVISRVGNESTLFPDDDSKIQTIVSWETDEPARCQMFYAQGLSKDEAASFPLEQGLGTHHVQVVSDFAPAQAYKFWVECADDNNNKSKSEDFVLYTPQKEKSIIDIILENFQGTFGWLKNLGIGGSSAGK